jgi:hypothetical protein
MKTARLYTVSYKTKNPYDNFAKMSNFISPANARGFSPKKLEIPWLLYKKCLLFNTPEYFT